MKLLVTTQAVDLDDAALGFFHEWLVALAAHSESIEVICLKEGRHALPQNVRVHSLGKEKTVSSKQKAVCRRCLYIVRFVRLAWELRHEYDAVFVHMNQEYILLAGLLWKLLGKRVVLWRNHRQGSWQTRLAVTLSSSICYTSPDAFVAYSPKAVQMPIGIDTDTFTPSAAPAAQNTILFLGRLDPVKRVEAFVEALGLLSLPYRANLYGSPTDPASTYAKHIHEQVKPLVEKGILALHPSVTHERVRELYRSHAIYVNLTPSGSFDKTIGEAMASGCVVVCANEAVRGVVPAALVTTGEAADVARALGCALGLPTTERAALTSAQRAYVASQHGLKVLAEKLGKALL